MDNMYFAILVILALLAVFDLIVGVSNDAANFLNSAIGSRAARRSFIIGAAAIGVVIGASLSSGMMEVARNGIFSPEAFTFHEVMMLFLAVMLTDVVLLDLFNTFGMPTSTTVSLVFELLGAAIAVAVYKMNHVEGSLQNLEHYIESAKVAKIIGGILLSIVVAFSCGCIIMWISRVLFSFRYLKSYKYIGAIWCAIALTAISYFVMYKGLGKSTIVSKDTIKNLNDNVGIFILCSMGAWFVITFVMQHVFKLNTLRFIALVGTAALALAFAGNDLVNFIGVFMGAQTAFNEAASVAAAGGDYMNMPMTVLGEKAKADFVYLIGAGLIMVGALLFSRKARTVSDTEVKLARSNTGKERFGSSMASRMLVRYTISATRGIKAITPKPISKFVGNRFKPLKPEEETGAAFDLIRASVNLTVAALIITWATANKQPLSTTYVTFMVAMGSSLADRAWGRESAVYRITGVLAVVGGWFMTGILACSAAFIVASALMYWGAWGVALMLTLVIGIIVKTTLFHRKNVASQAKLLDMSNPTTYKQTAEDTAETISDIMRTYRATLKSLDKSDRSSLARLRSKARSIVRDIGHRRDDEILPSLQELPEKYAVQGQWIYRINESLQRLSESLKALVEPCYRHIDNGHEGLSEPQMQELLTMSRSLSKFYPAICEMMLKGDYESKPKLVEQALELNDEFAECITRHLAMKHMDEGNVRNDILYLGLLNESRALIRELIELTREQRQMDAFRQ